MVGRVLWIRICPSVLHLSILLSSSFLRIGSLVFSETLFDVRGPYGDKHDRAQYFWKNPIQAKMTKNVQEWPKNRISVLSRKIFSLVLSGNGVEWMYLLPFNILWKPHIWEKSGSQVIAKNAVSQSDFLANICYWIDTCL